MSRQESKERNRNPATHNGSWGFYQAGRRPRKRPGLLPPAAPRTLRCTAAGRRWSAASPGPPERTIRQRHCLSHERQWNHKATAKALSQSRKAVEPPKGKAVSYLAAEITARPGALALDQRVRRVGVHHRPDLLSRLRTGTVVGTERQQIKRVKGSEGDGRSLTVSVPPNVCM